MPPMDSFDDSHENHIIEAEKSVIRLIPFEKSKYDIQSKIEIDNLSIPFPYTPYRPQIIYMKKVIQSLNNKQHALLESPTGTGKTLCLLCATLAWLTKMRIKQKENGDREPLRIIYATRTHSQIRQIIRELKKTPYLPKIAILGSRDQYCIYSSINDLRGQTLNSRCVKATKDENVTEHCPYYRLANDSMYSNLPSIIEDIEELSIRGRKEMFCPYYYSRRLKDYCDLLITPYNYLLQANNGPFNIDLTHAIIIFDEAHNLPRACEEAATVTIGVQDITEVEKEMEILRDQIINVFKQPEVYNNDKKLQNKIQQLSEIDTQGLRTTSTDLDAVIQPLLSLKETLLQEGNKNNWTSELGIVSAGSGFLQNLTKITSSLIPQKVEPRVQQQIEPQQQKEHGSLSEFSNLSYQPLCHKRNQLMGSLQFQNGLHAGNLSIFLSKVAKMIEDLSTTQNWGLDVVQAFFTIVNQLLVGQLESESKHGALNHLNKNNQSLMEQQENELFLTLDAIKHYRLYSNCGEQKNDYKYTLWCLNPAVAMYPIVYSQAFNIILTSGTLNPMESWQDEIGIPFQISLNNDHIVSTANVLIGICKSADQNQPFDFSWQNRNSNELYLNLGRMLVQAVTVIPHGILVIFSSYQLLSKCTQLWSSGSEKLYDNLTKFKHIFIEPKSAHAISTMMRAYQKAVLSSDRNGALLFCVCRGKLAEGMDFPDELARAVFLVGVPWPPSRDQFIETKKIYLDQRQFLHNESASQNEQLNRLLGKQVPKVKTKHFEDKFLLTGRSWYFLQTIRAVNQSIGRIIRHKNDFGAIYLCDTRFSSPEMVGNLPVWVREEVCQWISTEEVVQASRKFFSCHKFKKECSTWPQEVRDALDDNIHVQDREMTAKVLQPQENKKDPGTQTQERLSQQKLSFGVKKRQPVELGLQKPGFADMGKRIQQARQNNIEESSTIDQRARFKVPRMQDKAPNNNIILWSTDDEQSKSSAFDRLKPNN